MGRVLQTQNGLKKALARMEALLSWQGSLMDTARVRGSHKGPDLVHEANDRAAVVFSGCTETCSTHTRFPGSPG